MEFSSPLSVRNSLLICLVGQISNLQTISLAGSFENPFDYIHRIIPENIPGILWKFRFHLLPIYK